MERFQIFGSEDSLDYDVMVFVNEIPEIIDQSHKLCKMYDVELSKILTDKPINSNLAIIKDGFVIKVFKGTSDEVEKDSYTKNGIIQNYTDLTPMLRREKLSEKDYKVLNKYLDRLIKLSESRVDKMLRLVE